MKKPRNLPVNGCFTENPSARLQAISFYLAEIYTELDICRLLCYRASWMKDQNMRFDTENAMAKSYTCDAAVRCANKAVEIHGSYGILQEYKVQRLLRDAMVTMPPAAPDKSAKSCWRERHWRLTERKNK